MSKRTRYTISLLPSDIDIIEHLENVKEHTTISMYVRNLIKGDLNGSYRGNLDIDQVVVKVIQRIREDDEFYPNITSKSEEIAFSDDQRDIISSLF
jgi:hypothetical protein